jgi:hypothetical protein
MKNKYLNIIFLWTICCILYTLFPPPLHADEQVTKKYTYNIYWLGLRGGQAELEFITSTESIIIRTHASSAPFISLFYKVDDRAQSILDAYGIPQEFVLKTREGKHRRHKITEFKVNPVDNALSAVFHNVLDNEVVEFPLQRQAYDPLSAFYEMSTRSIKIGEPEFIDIFDNKKLYNAEVKILKRERVTVPAGSFDTIKVKPLLKSEGLFRKTGDIHLWVTDDDRKLPVLFTSKAVIGKFKVMLVDGDI